MQVFHVIYTSHAVRPLSLAQQGELLSTARERNYRHKLTGLLLYTQERFMQVLEGPEHSVRHIYASIERDRRHCDIDVLRFEHKQRRDFPDWRMGFHNFAVAAENLPFVSNFLAPDFDTDAYRDETSEAYQMLINFRDARDDWPAWG